MVEVILISLLLPLTITNACAQKTLNHEQRDKNLRFTNLDSRLNGVGLRKCLLTISSIIQCSQPARRNEQEISAIRNEHKIGAYMLACFPLH